MNGTGTVAIRTEWASPLEMGAIQKRRPRPGLVKTMWWPKETGVKIVILSLSSVESPVPNAYSKLRGGSHQEE